MAEIYGIQKEAQGANIGSQERIQLQNDASKYFADAANGLYKIGELINDRANREATYKMETTKAQIDDYIKNFSDFTDDNYMEIMQANAQKMWDDSYGSLSRDQRIMFDRNNPSAGEIMKVGIARGVGEVALNHEVEDAKRNNDIKATQIMLDEKGNLLNSQGVMDNLEIELNKVRDNPGFENFPDQRKAVEYDLGHKTIKGSLDMALAEGKLGTAQNLIGDESARTFLSPSEIASYKANIIAKQKALEEEAEKHNTTSAKVTETEDKIKIFYDAGARTGDALGISRDVWDASFHDVMSQIIHGVPADKLVSSEQFKIFQSVIARDPSQFGEFSKLANFAGVTKDGKPVTYKDLFGSDNIYALQVAAKNASAAIAKANNASLRGAIRDSQSILDNTINNLIDSSKLDSDEKQSMKQSNQELIINIDEQGYDDLTEAVQVAERYESALNEQQQKQLDRARRLIATKTDRVSRIFGLASQNSPINMTDASYKGDEDYYLVPRNFYSGNLPLDWVEESTSGKTGNYRGSKWYHQIPGVLFSGNLPISLVQASISGKNAVPLTSLLQGLTQDDIQEGTDSSWDSIVASVTNSFESDELPDPGTYGYLVSAVVGKLAYEANYRQGNSDDMSNTAIALGAQGRFIGGKQMLDIRKELLAENNLFQGGNRNSMVADSSTAPIEQTQIYSILTSALRKAGFNGVPGKEEEYKNAVKGIAESLRTTMRSRGKALLVEISKKQANMFMNRRNMSITNREAKAVRDAKEEKARRVFGK